MSDLIPNEWTILHVDDDQDTLDMREILLKDVTLLEKPIRFLKAQSVEEAKEILKLTTNIHLILMDVVMSGWTHAGLELSRYIREEMQNKRTRIVILTGEPFQVNIERMLGYYGCDLILRKTEEAAAIKELFVEKLEKQLTEYVATPPQKIYKVLHFEDDWGWKEMFKMWCELTKNHLNLLETFDNLDNWQQKIEEYKPDALVMDIGFKIKCDTLLILPEIREKFPHLKIIILTGHDSIPFFWIAKDYVHGYLRKTSKGLKALEYIHGCIDGPNQVFDEELSEAAKTLVPYMKAVNEKFILAILLKKAQLDLEFIGMLLNYNKNRIQENLIDRGEKALKKKNLSLDDF